MASLIWITGLSGAGKTTIAGEVLKQLQKRRIPCVRVDGDAVREICGHDLGHSLVDRKKNAWRIAKLCRYLVSQDMTVVCSTMSLYSEIHRFNRRSVKRYYEIYIHADLKALLRHDKNALYRPSLAGKRKHVTGVDLPFDRPAADLTLDNSRDSGARQKALRIVTLCLKKGI